MQFPLQERAGRNTLSAEDLLDFALESGAFTPVAIFGVEDCKDAVLYGGDVGRVMSQSYR
jgi:hypothetical protein